MLSENEVGNAEMPPSYGRKVGERLRAIRRQKRLSLQEVLPNRRVIEPIW